VIQNYFYESAKIIKTLETGHKTFTEKLMKNGPATRLSTTTAQMEQED
jgi:hypothetical protein